jgi:multidrug resistance efflux pump
MGASALNNRYTVRFAVMVAFMAGLAGCAKPPPSPSNTPSSDAQYVAVARGRIDVEGGLIALTANREGTVVSVPVRQGQQVRKGDTLVALDATEARLALSESIAGIRQAEGRMRLLAQQKKSAAAKADRLIAASRAGVGEAQLADDAIAATAELDAEEHIAASTLATAKIKAESARFEVDQRILRSPLAGTVVQLNVQPGVATKALTGAMLTLLPESPRIVRAELNENYVSQIALGMTAQVGAEDDNTKMWSATVVRISAVVTAAELEEDPQRRAAARTVECVLSLDAKADLRVGQRVLVRFRKAADQPKL